MDEYFLAALFERELDVLKCQGEKFVRHVKHAQLETALQAAKVCLETDFAPESQIRTKLLEELLAKFSSRNSRPTVDMVGGYGEDSEFEELDLSEVVGGVADPSVGGCTFCGCSQSASSLNQEDCPNCGHSRSAHR